MSAASYSAQPLPKPGEIVQRDFRTAQNTAPVASSSGRPLRLVQWNIERGYQLSSIIEHLSALDADIISLQEIDIGCERSGSLDTGAAIAQALHLNYAFLCEFEELHSPLRTPATQGGGVHGNATLSKFDFTELRAVEHSRHPVDWEQPVHALALREPRRGRRRTLAATVATPQGPLRVYNCHLEVFCGMLDRIWQLSDVFQDVRSSGPGPAAILGDLNTMAHGVARLSRHYCCDRMRWRTLGVSEAVYWERHVLSVREPDSVNTHLQRLGLPDTVCAAAVNPGFADPFDAARDFTLDHPSYRILGYGLMQGKLDWVLLRGLEASYRCIGNHDFAASDHKWLLVECQVSVRDAM